MRKIENYTAFFGADDVFSNWHPCQFSYHGVAFTSAEQFMMYAKAMLFDDDACATQILSVSAPKKQKSIGRRVKGFDQATWEARRESIVFVACREKFSQNPDFKAMLLGTAPTVLVEARPYDRIWGVGIGERDARISDPRAWRGLNLLGTTLMKVRDALS